MLDSLTRYEGAVAPDFDRTDEPPVLPCDARGVCFEAGGGLLIDHVDLQLGPGAVTVLIGPNGAGKSLLLSGCCTVMHRTDKPAPILWQGDRPLRDTQVAETSGHGVPEAGAVAPVGREANIASRAADKRMLAGGGNGTGRRCMQILARGRPGRQGRRASGAAPVGRRTASVSRSPVRSRLEPGGAVPGRTDGQSRSRIDALAIEDP